MEKKMPKIITHGRVDLDLVELIEGRAFYATLLERIVILCREGASADQESGGA